jgi:lysozyme
VAPFLAPGRVTVALSQNQVDALHSFVFNIGGEAFTRSTLLRLLNQGQFESASREFSRWVYSGGVQLPGLVQRRADEEALFNRR